MLRLKPQASTTEKLLSWLYQPTTEAVLPSLEPSIPVTTSSWLSRLPSMTGWLNPFKNRSALPKIAMASMLITQLLPPAAAFCLKSSEGYNMALTCHGDEDEQALFNLFQSQCGAQLSHKMIGSNDCVAMIMVDIWDMKITPSFTANFGQSYFGNPICTLDEYKVDECLDTVLRKNLHDGQLITKEKILIALGSVGFVALSSAIGYCLFKCCKKPATPVEDLEASKPTKETPSEEARLLTY